MRGFLLSKINVDIKVVCVYSYLNKQMKEIPL
jgi:hypothetical protein